MSLLIIIKMSCIKKMCPQLTVNSPETSPLGGLLNVSKPIHKTSAFGKNGSFF